MSGVFLGVDPPKMVLDLLSITNDQDVGSWSVDPAPFVRFNGVIFHDERSKGLIGCDHAVALELLQFSLHLQNFLLGFRKSMLPKRIGHIEIWGPKKNQLWHVRFDFLPHTVTWLEGSKLGVFSGPLKYPIASTLSSDETCFNTPTKYLTWIKTSQPSGITMTHWPWQRGRSHGASNMPPVLSSIFLPSTPSTLVHLLDTHTNQLLTSWRPLGIATATLCRSKAS